MKNKEKNQSISLVSVDQNGKENKNLVLSGKGKDVIVAEVHVKDLLQENQTVLEGLTSASLKIYGTEEGKVDRCSLTRDDGSKISTLPILRDGERAYVSVPLTQAQLRGDVVLFGLSADSQGGEIVFDPQEAIFEPVSSLVEASYSRPSMNNDVSSDGTIYCSCNNDGYMNFGNPNVAHGSEVHFGESFYLDLNTSNARTTYYEGDYFNVSGIEAYAWTRGYSQRVDIYVPPKRLVFGQTKVTAYCHELSKDIPITVLPRIYKSTPVCKEIPLGPKAEARIFLQERQFVAAFTDLMINDGSISFEISHVHRNDAWNDKFGKRWDINLSQRIYKFDKSSLVLGDLTDFQRNRLEEADYIFLDENGKKCGFDEVFYYVNDYGQKIHVSKDSVWLGDDGQFHYGGKVVRREFKNRFGLTLISGIDEFSGSHRFDSNQDIKNLRTQIKQITQSINEISETKEALNKRMGSEGIPYEVQNAGFRTLSSLGLESSYSSKTRLLEDIQLQLQKCSSVTIEEINDREKPKDQAQADFDRQQRRSRLQWALSTYARSVSKAIQGADSTKSAYDRCVQTEETYRKQKEEMELKLKNLLISTPVAYLVDGSGTIRCFNEDGNLCAVVRGDDQLTIQRNLVSKNIEALVVNEKIVHLDYYPDGKLKCIRSFDGRTVSYHYSGDNLSEVIFSDLTEKLSFSYSDEQMTLADFGTGQGRIHYENEMFKEMDMYSDFSTVTPSGAYGGYSFVNSFSLFAKNRNTFIFMDGEGNEETYVIGDDDLSQTIITKPKAGNRTMEHHHRSLDDSWEYYTRVTERPIYESNLYYGGSENPIAVIDFRELKGSNCFIFNARAIFCHTDFPTSTPFYSTPFRSDGTRTYSTVCLVAEIWNGSMLVKTYQACPNLKDYFSPYVSLPVEIPTGEYGPDTSIRLYVKSSSSNVKFTDIFFSRGSYAYDTCDDFGKLTRSVSGYSTLDFKDSGTFQREEILYFYDDADRVTKKEKTVTTAGNISRIDKSVKEISYDGNGNVVSQISSDSEKTVFTYRSYAEKGKTSREVTYDSLDPSQKFISIQGHDTENHTAKQSDETGKWFAEASLSTDNGRILNVKHANGTVTGFTYDKDGNMTSVSTSSDGIGNANRLFYTKGFLTKVVSDNYPIEYTYDGNGRITSMGFGSFEIEKSYENRTYSSKIDSVTIGNMVFDDSCSRYDSTVHKSTTSDNAGKHLELRSYEDEKGRVVRTTANIAGSEKTLAALKYNDRDQVVAVGDNTTGSVFKNTYDCCGRVVRQAQYKGDNVPSLTSNYTFDDYGDLEKIEMTGDISQTYVIHRMSNLARDISQVDMPVDLRCYPKKDSSGRNIGKTISFNHKYVLEEKFGYRQEGEHSTRMISAFDSRILGEDMPSVHVSYDMQGNISEITEDGELVSRFRYDCLGRLIREDNADLDKSFFYSYDGDGNRTNKSESVFSLEDNLHHVAKTNRERYLYENGELVGAGKTKLEYDCFGNLIKYGNHALEFGELNMLSKFDGLEFMYDAYGRRIRKGTRVFSYDFENRLLRQADGDEVIDFIYDTEGISGFGYKGKTYLYVKDVLRNVASVICLEDGETVSSYAYDAFGNVTVLEDKDGIGSLNPIRYRGYFYDYETGLYYLISRYYDPKTGRFISRDDESYLDPEKVNGLNPYVYCRSNPVMYVDPDGRFLFSLGALLIGGLIGALISGATSIISQGIQNGWNNISWWQVGFDSLTGTIGGLIGASGIGLAGSILLNGALGVVSSIGTDLIYFKGDFGKVDWFKAGYMGFVGLLLGALGGPGAQSTKDLSNGLLRGPLASGGSPMKTAMAHYLTGSISQKGLQGAINLFVKESGVSLSKEISSLIVKNIIKGTIFSIIGSAISSFGSWLWSKEASPSYGYYYFS